jgi:RNA polymerase subunit RPABC4/transcription elongation factor Spt4
LEIYGILILAIIIGLIPAVIAQSKGQSFVLWWVYGAAIFIVALPHALIMKADKAALERAELDNDMRKCPACAELIKEEAKKCRYCGTLLADDYHERTAIKEAEKALRKAIVDNEVGTGTIIFVLVVGLFWAVLLGYMLFVM